MSTQLQICNMALYHLGMQSVTALSDVGNPSVDACNVFYTPALDDIYREFGWPFATSRVLLTEVSNTAASVIGWDYIYEYPDTAANIFSVFDEGSVDTKEDQEFEVLYDPTTTERVICSNLEDAYAECSYKITDTTLFDPKFVLALTYKLAAMMAHQLVGGPDVGLKMMELYSGVLSEAKRGSGKEKLKKPKQTSSYQNSRG
jgi:hypothetical protein